MIQLTEAQRRIVLDILKQRISDRKVYAFGSRVTGTQKHFADLDLVVVGDAPISLDIVGMMREDFSESDLPFRVDIVDWATTNPEFQQIMQGQWEQVQ